MFVCLFVCLSVSLSCLSVCLFPSLSLFFSLTLSQLTFTTLFLRREPPLLVQPICPIISVFLENCGVYNGTIKWLYHGQRGFHTCYRDIRLSVRHSAPPSSLDTEGEDPIRKPLGSHELNRSNNKNETKQQVNLPKFWNKTTSSFCPNVHGQRLL